MKYFLVFIKYHFLNKDQLYWLKTIVEHKREFYYLNFDLSVFDYNEYTKDSYNSLINSLKPKPSSNIEEISPRLPHPFSTIWYTGGLQNFDQLALSKMDKKILAWMSPCSLIRPLFILYKKVSMGILYNFTEKYNIFSYVKDRFTSSIIIGNTSLSCNGMTEYIDLEKKKFH